MTQTIDERAYELLEKHKGSAPVGIPNYAVASLTEALTRIEKLEGALRPFIKAAGCLHDDEQDDMPIFLRWETNIKAGDLRRAAALTQEG